MIHDDIGNVRFFHIYIRLLANYTIHLLTKAMGFQTPFGCGVRLYLELAICINGFVNRLTR